MQRKGIQIAVPLKEIFPISFIFAAFFFFFFFGFISFNQTQQFVFKLISIHKIIAFCELISLLYAFVKFIRVA